VNVAVDGWAGVSGGGGRAVNGWQGDEVGLGVISRKHIQSYKGLGLLTLTEVIVSPECRVMVSVENQESSFCCELA